jgi:tRNA threonylcarbamoyl adenosine modification protein (Sua5/YciO/YrdC/YwlC family)
MMEKRINTRVVKVDPENIDYNIIKKAAEIINRGGLVVFPTETVYGIGADALNDEAVDKIFKAKGRPQDNPLIVHIADFNQLYDLALEVPEKAELLAERFWPGPLTMILYKKEILSDKITAGLNTAAIRLPVNEIALALIKESNKPIAAPSANTSGRPSPTEASHVIEDLMGKVDMIIDGGSTYIGLESTVVVIQHCSQEVVCCPYSMKVSRKVEIYILHGHNLSVSPSCCPAFHPENRTQGRLAKCYDGFLSKPGQGIPQSYRSRCLAFACRCRGYGRNQD